MTVIEAIIASLIATALPVVFWYIILNHKNRSGYMGRFLFVFILSGIGAMAVFQFGDLMESWLLGLGLSLFVVYLLFGAVIEYGKNFVVRIGGWRYFQTIDDVMDLSFAAALGFVAFENFFHFYLMFSGQMPGISGDIIEMIKFFLRREFFVLPIHLFVSGIFGYFYGLGLFAKEDLQEKAKNNWSHRLLRGFFFWVPRKRLYKAVRIAEGMIISVGFYALFFTLLKMDPTLQDVMELIGYWDPRETLLVNEHLIPIISFVFFKFGTLVLFSLMDQKRRWDKRDLLHGKS